ncbi:MAG: hypothetical protein ABMA00_08960 [Gemmatimonas sp.]
METETIDRLFLELSQFTRATTAKELALREPMMTYTVNQPNNANARTLGEACQMAAESPGGDYIDQGLQLLRELEKQRIRRGEVEA